MLTQAVIDRVVAAALEEDAPWGDLTSEYLIVETAVARADLVAREPGVFSGGAVFEAAFRLTDPRVAVQLIVEDGEWFEAGAVLAVVTGPARVRAHGRADRAQLRAADVGHRHADRALCRRGRAHERPDRRHAQDDSAACAPSSGTPS